MTEAEILKCIADICRKYHTKEAILYGSRAKGTATARSDFDIAVSGTNFFVELKEEIENIPTLYSFDVVDMEQCENQLLLEEIRAYGRKIC